MATETIPAAAAKTAEPMLDSKQTTCCIVGGGPGGMMLALLLDLPLPKTGSFDIEYTSVTQVALHPHMNEIELLNFTPWRDVLADGHHESK